MRCPGAFCHHRGQLGVTGQRVDHRFGVGIEVQQPPAAGDRGGEVAEVVEHQQAADVIDGRCQGDDGAAAGKPQAAPVRAVADLLATGHGAGGQMAEDALVGERCAYRQPKGHRPRRIGSGFQGPGPDRRAFAQRRRCAFEHQAHGVVELADAGKPGGESDVAERQLRGLDQHPGGLGPLRAGQREWPGADLGLQQPLQLAGGVTEVGREAADAFAVHRAVGDQPHRPRNDVTAHVPFGRPRRRVGTASLACPESRSLSGRRGRIEPHVASERRPHRAAGPAIDPGRQHRGDEPAVEPGVLGLDRPVAAFEIVVHASSLHPPTDKTGGKATW